MSLVRRWHRAALVAIVSCVYGGTVEYVMFNITIALPSFHRAVLSNGRTIAGSYTDNNVRTRYNIGACSTREAHPPSSRRLTHQVSAKTIMWAVLEINAVFTIINCFPMNECSTTHLSTTRIYVDLQALFYHSRGRRRW